MPFDRGQFPCLMDSARGQEKCAPKERARHLLPDEVKRLVVWRARHAVVIAQRLPAW
jgi:hypothetical protein